MGVTITVLMAILIACLAIPIISIGMVFLIIYFFRRPKVQTLKKHSFIIPFALICVGEIFLFPVCWLGILLTSTRLSETTTLIISILSISLLLSGIILLMYCAIKSLHGKKTKNITLITAVILFLLGFVSVFSYATLLLMLFLTSH